MFTSCAAGEPPKGTKPEELANSFKLSSSTLPRPMLGPLLISENKRLRGITQGNHHYNEGSALFARDIRTETLAAVGVATSKGEPKVKQRIALHRAHGTERGGVCAARETWKSERIVKERVKVALKKLEGMARRGTRRVNLVPRRCNQVRG